ncbi:RIP metalloprotease RseP [Soehngenia longivitae]|uniref:Zinc metalloprotease n=1 Tax=Soehngenia longivitae TaxID=2562294 RepID=A0A4Z0D5D2_9FIRM|nr:RIP metalloprotease RseP [Soehngenia longivitae]TFZ39822.1 RIP metalloprotease RseP [Soehngenia longivitae]
MTVIAAIFVFLIVILIHELGHFTVAKLVGIKVNELSIGMGPRFYHRKRGDTEYSIRALPIGGYVKMEGEDEESDDPRGFSKKSPLARIAVVAAGAIMNFILAIIVLSIISFMVGEPTTTISEVIENSPAELAGLRPGDKIISISDNKIESWDDIVNSIENSDIETKLEIKVERDNDITSIFVTPNIEDGKKIIGIVPEGEGNLITAIKEGFSNTAYFIKLMIDFIMTAFSGNVSADDLSGPLGVISAVNQAANQGIISLLYLLAFISVNLGFINLLPFPALDGGRIVFLIVELVRGKPIDQKKEGLIHFIGLILLFALMIFVTYNDILRTNLF